MYQWVHVRKYMEWDLHVIVASYQAHIMLDVHQEDIVGNEESSPIG